MRPGRLLHKLWGPVELGCSSLLVQVLCQQFFKFPLHSSAVRGTDYVYLWNFAKEMTRDGRVVGADHGGVQSCALPTTIARSTLVGVRNAGARDFASTGLLEFVGV